MQADAHTLSALCESADNDIRSCLNTLQVIIYYYYLSSIIIIYLFYIISNLLQ